MASDLECFEFSELWPGVRFGARGIWVVETKLAVRGGARCMMSKRAASRSRFQPYWRRDISGWCGLCAGQSGDESPHSKTTTLALASRGAASILPAAAGRSLDALLHWHGGRLHEA